MRIVVMFPEYKCEWMSEGRVRMDCLNVYVSPNGGTGKSWLACKLHNSDDAGAIWYFPMMAGSNLAEYSVCFNKGNVRRGPKQY